VNHCLLEVEVLEAPQIRYTQDNQTAVAEMTVRFDGLRPEDPPGQLKVVGWGNLAQELPGLASVGQRLVLEGRLRMNTVARADGVKEKRAEFTLARLHPLSGAAIAQTAAPATGQTPPPAANRGSERPAPARRASAAAPAAPTPAARPEAPEPPVWNTAPLVPDLPDGDDDIPF
jgi:single-strand DNA-binding protein